MSCVLMITCGEKEKKKLAWVLLPFNLANFRKVAHFSFGVSKNVLTD